MVPEIWSANRQNFLSFWTISLPFYPPNNPENQDFEYMKKMPVDIILHTCTINENYMIYGSRDMEHNRQNFFFSLWAIFCPFTPLTHEKSKFKKMRKTPGVIILHMCTKN